MTTAVVSLLTKQSVSRLREMRDDVRSQLRSLEFESELIERALAEKGHSSSQPDTNGHKPAKPRTRGNKRETFRDILSTRPDHAWMPAELRTALAMQGVESSSAAIRVMLRRMAEDGEVMRGEDGNGWKLAPTSDSRQESLVGNTSWRAGGMDDGTPPAPNDGLG